MSGRAAGLALLVAALALLPTRLPVWAAGAYELPPMLNVTATAPAHTFGSQTHLACIARTELGIPPQVTVTMMCNQASKPSSMPPPPSPPIDPSTTLSLVGEYNKATGQGSLPIFNCVEFFGVSALDVTLEIDMAQEEHTLVLLEDTTPPLDCQDAVESTGPLTLTPVSAERDTDGDGCPDLSEVGLDEQQGGMRDPFNPWDYWNPTLDGQNRVDDQLHVINQYFIDHPEPDYTYLTDRTSIVGGDPWDMWEPNGQQRVDDILAIIKQYSHDCGTGNKILPNPSWWPEGKDKPPGL